MARPRRLYFPRQPKRCAGEAAGLGGACLACGAAEGDLCRAPPSDRYKPGAAK